MATRRMLRKEPFGLAMGRLPKREALGFFIVKSKILFCDAARSPSKPIVVSVQ